MRKEFFLADARECGCGNLERWSIRHGGDPWLQCGEATCPRSQTQHAMAVSLTMCFGPDRRHISQQQGFRSITSPIAARMASRHLRVCSETDPACGVTAEARQVASAHIWVTVKILLQKSD
jgi:hypothetical protein